MKTFMGIVAGTLVGLFVFFIISGIAQAIGKTGTLGALASIALVILAIIGGIKAGSVVYTKISGKTPKQLSFFKKKEAGQIKEPLSTP